MSEVEEVMTGKFQLQSQIGILKFKKFLILNSDGSIHKIFNTSQEMKFAFPLTSTKIGLYPRKSYYSRNGKNLMKILDTETGIISCFDLDWYPPVQFEGEWVVYQAYPFLILMSLCFMRISR
jgi:hypothetical protein